jgi:DNA helicase II / ATP-dependent DNA helicase PcrA
VVIAASTALYTPAGLARLLGLPEPTPEQARVIAAPMEPLVVAAGAGSGKSETMAARVVWLVANGLVRPERVLGLTFTRKAAAELSERVRRRLDGLRRAGLDIRRAAAEGDRESPDAGPADRVGTSPEAAAPGAAAALLAGEPAVFTYHAYAGRILAEHAVREALEPSLRLITPAVQWQIAARVVNGYGGPVDKIRWTPATVTAAVLELAGELAEHLRTTGDIRVLGERLAAEAAALAGAGGSGRRGPGRRDPARAPRGGAAGNGGPLPAAARRILETQQIREQLLPMAEAFAAAKASREVIDYGDQVALSARIAVRHPAVGAAERSRYQVVLLDEYQDTSHAQLVLLRALFGSAGGEPAAYFGHPVTAVGDPCQSIYGWRGASAGNLRRFRDDFRPARQPATGRAGRPGAERAGPPAPLAQLCALSTTFRNTERVLDVAAALQADLRAEASEVPRLVPAPVRGGRGAVASALLRSAADEADWIAGRLAQLLNLPPGIAPDGKRWPDGRADTGQRVRPSDIAVLCRKRAQFPLLRAAIEARGIPVEVVGLGGLLTVPEVQDVVATLRVLHDPGASDALARLLTGPRWRIGPADLVALGRRARSLGDGATAAPPAGQADDAVGQAIADMTADPGSLIEALDDLGDPGPYSRTGYARLSVLAGELRTLRGNAGQPLPDLVTEVERALGLDIEVAARPDASPASARADLDAFADAAAAFAGDEEEPTLGAFLAYLAAAETEEFGLEAGRVSGTDSVKLMTVHAAKGLQWPAVFVPGLAAGPRSQVFPARPRTSTRWTDNPRTMPFAIRGDAVDLPRLRGLDEDSVSAFTDAAAERHLREERRLAYVAVTRAEFWLCCSGYWWGDGSAPLGPSVFLQEVRAACEAGAGQVQHWEPPPGEEAENPALAEPPSAPWPAAPSGSRHAAVRSAAALVQEELAALPSRPGSPGPGSPGPLSSGTRRARPAASPAGDTRASMDSPGTGHDEAPGEVPGGASPVAPGGDAAALSEADRARADAWQRDAELLLAERAARLREAAGDSIPVDLPARMSVSSLVALARDPGEFARWVRRPMPRPPAPQARRGTAFHRWLETRFGQQQLIDPDELPGAADDDAEAGMPAGATPADADLAELQDRFTAGEWADRVPREVEVPFEMMIGDRLVRGRIDAVFDDAGDGCFDVVDWKTGHPPETDAERHAVAVQLAAYRLAWSGLTGVPPEQVRAAFYYVRDDLTVRPADLLGADGIAALVSGLPGGSG